MIRIDKLKDTQVCSPYRCNNLIHLLFIKARES